MLNAIIPMPKASARTTHNVGKEFTCSVCLATSFFEPANGTETFNAGMS
jgi:hypothetical protein